MPSALTRSSRHCPTSSVSTPASTRVPRPCAPIAAGLPVDGDVVGFLTVEQLINPEISWMAVHPEHRHCGLAKDLVSAAVDVLTSEGHTLLTLLTLGPSVVEQHADNYSRTRRFYCSVGFEAVRELDLVGWGPSTGPTLVHCGRRRSTNRLLTISIDVIDIRRQSARRAQSARVEQCDGRVPCCRSRAVRQQGLGGQSRELWPRTSRPSHSRKLTKQSRPTVRPAAGRRRRPVNAARTPSHPSPCRRR